MHMTTYIYTAVCRVAAAAAAPRHFRAEVTKYVYTCTVLHLLLACTHIAYRWTDAVGRAGRSVASQAAEQQVSLHNVINLSTFSCGGMERLSSFGFVRGGLDRNRFRLVWGKR
jgi:hypothetical protein